MSRYRIVFSAHFKKDIKIAERRGYDLRLIEHVVDLLAEGEELPSKYKDHKLVGKYIKCRECYITPD